MPPSSKRPPPTASGGDPNANHKRPRTLPTGQALNESDRIIELDDGSTTDFDDILQVPLTLAPPLVPPPVPSPPKGALRSGLRSRDRQVLFNIPEEDQGNAGSDVEDQEEIPPSEHSSEDDTNYSQTPQSTRTSRSQVGGKRPPSALDTTASAPATTRRKPTAAVMEAIASSDVELSVVQV